MAFEKRVAKLLWHTAYLHLLHKWNRHNEIANIHISNRSRETKTSWPTPQRANLHLAHNKCIVNHLTNYQIFFKHNATNNDI
jgi:hypothetical protein